MFTGIITDVGTIEAIEQRGDLRVRIATHYDTETIEMGASIACSGACLTVVQKGPEWFAVDISAESVACTAADRWRTGNSLNLERALKVGDELGGHIVTGHVDGIGTVTAVAQEGDSTRVTIAVPDTLAPHLAAKGSITVDGVSLTVNEVADTPEGTRFGINIIPHTSSVTTLSELAPGRQVNLEIDVLSRYLLRVQDYRNHMSV